VTGVTDGARRMTRTAGRAAAIVGRVVSHTVTIIVSIAAFTVGFLVPAVVCALKGKPWFVVLGLLGSCLFVVVGAIRLAKPGSWWYEQRYDDEQKLRADERFRKPAIGEWRVDDRGRFYTVAPSAEQSSP
jgi:hypothetical protein